MPAFRNETHSNVHFYCQNRLSWHSCLLNFAFAGFTGLLSCIWSHKKKSRGVKSGTGPPGPIHLSPEVESSHKRDFRHSWAPSCWYQIPGTLNNCISSRWSCRTFPRASATYRSQVKWPSKKYGPTTRSITMDSASISDHCH